MELDSKRWTTSIAKHTQSVLSRCFFSMQFPNVNYFRQQCLNPPFSKGDLAANCCETLNELPFQDTRNRRCGWEDRRRAPPRFDTGRMEPKSICSQAG